MDKGMLIQLWFIISRNFPCNDGSSFQCEVRHMSLDFVSNNATAEEILAPCPRTILVRWEKDCIKTPLRVATYKFMSSEALKSSSVKTHMGNLKHIHYLDCSNSCMSELPEAT
ncbi:hypothetical protein CFC21_095232, partial [Triticum aestivum]|uniref:Uncharacterized protein n=2 Tax=Triticum aestivum TaxID=4565 RepID=A0A3B6RAT9_WHEAT